MVVRRQQCQGMLGVRSASIPILLPLVPKTSAGDRAGSGIRMSREREGAASCSHGSQKPSWSRGVEKATCLGSGLIWDCGHRVPSSCDPSRVVVC